MLQAYRRVANYMHGSCTGVDGDPVIDHLFLANIMAVEQYLDGLQSVIEGADPSAAVEMVEDSATAASRLRNQGKVHPPAL